MKIDFSNKNSRMTETWFYHLIFPRLRIAYFTDTFYPTTNGIVTSIITFAKELSDRGHEILIIVPDNAWVEDFSYPGIEILPVKGFPAFFYPDFKITFGFTPGLLRKIRAFKPDLIHFHTQFILGWEAIVLGKLLKIPRIGTFHTYIADEGYLKVIGLENFRIFGELGWKYNNFFYEHCEHVIAPSENSAIELSEHGIPSEKITILQNPVVVNSSARIEKEVPKTENIVLYVGRLSAEKELPVCLETVYVVSRELPDVQFIIVGDGPERENLMELAEDLGILNNVTFLGKIEHSALLESNLFDRAKLFLTASPTETQGITLLEAMNFGLPIVGVDAKWVGELIEDNWFKARVGNYGELALYCLRILFDQDLQKSLGAKSQELVKKYDVITLTDDLENMYHQVIKNGPRKK